MIQVDSSLPLAGGKTYQHHNMTARCQVLLFVKHEHIDKVAENPGPSKLQRTLLASNHRCISTILPPSADSGILL